jgi:hypothetical protein
VPIALLLLACTTSASPEAPPPAPQVPAAPPAPPWSAPQLLAHVRDPVLQESSGLARSGRAPGRWWTLNDSGGEPTLYAFDESGALLGASPVPSATNRDWEDLALGPCPGKAEPCLYIGDIGDNKEERPELTVYAVPEPEPGQPASILATWTLTYPDERHDAETLLVHPKTGQISIVTKKKKGRAGVYDAPLQPGPAAMTQVGIVDLSGKAEWQRRLTAGDWHPQGEAVVLRGYGPAWVFPATAGQPWWQASPETLDVGRVDQGEAIAWDTDGKRILVTAEGSPMPIIAVTRQP